MEKTKTIDGGDRSHKGGNQIKDRSRNWRGKEKQHTLEHGREERHERSYLEYEYWYIYIQLSSLQSNFYLLSLLTSLFFLNISLIILIVTFLNFNYSHFSLSVDEFSVISAN